MEQKAKDLIIKSLPRLKTIVAKFSTYQVAKIDIERILYFLSQFESYERIKVIIKLLDNIDFIDSARMTYLLNNAYNKVPSHLLEKPLISSLGSIQDSSAVVCYQSLKSLGKLVQITRINLESQKFEIPYEINFDEEAETIRGILEISLDEINFITKETEDEIFKTLDRLK